MKVIMDYETVNKLNARIAELEAIVTKLPKTKDGVTMRLGSNVFFSDDDGVVCEGGVLRYGLDGPDDADFEVRVRDADGCEYDLYSAQCYAARAAAEGGKK